MKFKVILPIILIAGILSVAFAFASASNLINQSMKPSPEYPTNQSGETYGSALDATSPETEPDLIKAYGVDGTLGYVRSADLKGPSPKTPEEALAQQAKIGSVKKIPLYDVDGKTVIGEFNITNGKGKEKK